MSILETARATLLPLMPPGWTLWGPRRLGPTTVELQLKPPDDQTLGVGLEWSEGEGPAYAKGPRYRASYRRGPGLVDLGEEGAEPALRSLALSACEALAALSEGPPLGLQSVGSFTQGVDPVDQLLEVLPRVVAEALGTEALPNPGGWRLKEVREMARWTRVAEVQLCTDERTLTMILTPTNPERPAFRRSAHYDLVYYSDDLAVSEHEALYERDRPMIDAFASWLTAWDR